MRELSAIHPTAVIDPTAHVGSNCDIGPFAVIEAGVKVGDNCRLAAHAVIRAGSELGDEVQVDSFAVIGGRPQMLPAKPTTGHVRIGDRTVVREGVTVNQPTQPGGSTTVGADCYLMANSHVGHDSTIGNSVTLANNVMLAGHVVVGDSAFLGGGAGVHQFVRIGEGTMIGGNASMSYDVPPFAIAAERNEISGLNLVGIRRRGMASADLADLKRCFHEVFRDGGNVRERAACVRQNGDCGTAAESRRFLEFFAAGTRGFARLRESHRRG